MEGESVIFNPLLEPVAVPKHTRKRNITILVAVSVVNVILLALFWTQLLTPAQKQGQPVAHSVSTASTGDIDSFLIGKPAPDFTLSVLDRSQSPVTTHLADYKGKPIILNFWASWCAPCNDEAAFLHKAWPALKVQGITLLGVDGSEKASAALAFMQKYGISYPNAQDTVNSTTAINYGVTGLPETIFIDRKGIVVAKWISVLNESGLRLEMTKLMR